MTMTTEECQANLADARKRYHELMTGTMARVIVDQNGQRVEFTAANSSALYNYILKLSSQCGCAGGTPMPINTGPAQFIF